MVPPMEQKAKHPWVSPMEQKAKHPWVSPMEQKAKQHLVSPWNKKRSILGSPPFEGGRKGDLKGGCARFNGKIYSTILAGLRPTEARWISIMQKKPIQLRAKVPLLQTQSTSIESAIAHRTPYPDTPAGKICFG